MFYGTNCKVVWLFYTNISKMNRISKEVAPELISSLMESIMSLSVKEHDKLIDSWIIICHTYYMQMKKSETINVNFQLTYCCEAKNSKACKVISFLIIYAIN